jgi:hypothetical protein
MKTKPQIVRSDILELVRDRVYQKANQADWLHLTIPEKKELYEKWTEDPEIGGLLRTIMPVRNIRVYLKDTYMGEYSRSKKIHIRELLKSMGVTCSSIDQEFIKPEAILCDQSKLYTVSRAKDWKIALINSFERAKQNSSISKNIMYLTEHTNGMYSDVKYRELIEDAGNRLGVTVIWDT